MKYCNNCGNQLNDAVKFCPVCGSKQPDVSIDRDHIEAIQTVEEPNNKKKKIILISSIIGAAVVMILAGVICLMFLFGNKESDPGPTTTEVTTTEETTTEKPTTEEPTTEDPVELENIAAIEAYHGMITGLVTDAVYCSSDTISVTDEYNDYVIYENYAIADFDSDGVSELMDYVEYSGSYDPDEDAISYGTAFHFYEYDAENDSVELIQSVDGCLAEISDGSLVFYGNGVIEMIDPDVGVQDDEGDFLCVSGDLFDIIGCADKYDYVEETNRNSFAICRSDDGSYMMVFCSNFSVDYQIDISEDEAKEYLDKLRDADTIDAEVNDFDLEELADVCGFDYDEAVAQIEENTPPIDYDAMYGDIIYKYKELVDEDADFYDIIGEDYPYETDENCSIYYSVAIGDTSGEIGYLISDLDGDGISELVIGVCDDSFVIDLYTIRNGSVVRILDSGERYASFYCGDGVFYQAGSSGAAYYSCTLYQLNSGYLTVTETVYSEPDEDNYDGSPESDLYYYSIISEYDPSNGTEISQDEYLEKIDEFSSKFCNLSGVTPLSEY